MLPPVAPIVTAPCVPGCGFCKKLKPDFSLAATELKGHSVSTTFAFPGGLIVSFDTRITLLSGVFFCCNVRITYK